MNKDGLKNIILFSLILFSLFLTSQIWFDSSIWEDSQGYESLPLIGRLFNSSSGVSALNLNESLNDLAKPFQIVVNKSIDTRAVYYKQSKNYDKIIEKFFDYFDLIASNPDLKYSVVSEAEFIKSISENSIIASYGNVMDTEFVVHTRKIENSALSGVVKCFSDIIITSGQKDDTISVYIMDCNTYNYYKFTLTSSFEKLRPFIHKFAVGSGNYAFASELNLDVKPNAEEAPRMYLDSLVLLKLDESEAAEKVRITNPIDDNDDKLYDRMVGVFDIKPNRLRFSKDNGVYSYIENTSTVTIDTNGRVEYTMADESSGKYAETMHDKISLIMQYVTKQFNVASYGYSPDVKIVSDLVQTEGKITIEMSYEINDRPVIVETLDGYEPCIKAHFVGNRLVKFTMLLRRMEDTGIKAKQTSVLEALDSAYSHTSSNSIISNIFECYTASATGDITSSPKLGIIQKGRIFISN